MMLIAIALLGCERAGAGQNVWTPIGPDGGRGYELCVDGADPRRAWTVVDAGVFTTSDGHHWRRLPIEDRVYALANGDGAVLYAGGDRDFAGFVRRSDDGGETWGPHLAVPIEVDEMAVAPRTPDAIYASDGVDRIAASRDGGTTWRVVQVDGLLRDTLAVDPHRTGRVYAAGVGGVHRSDDFGVTWSFSAVNGIRTVAADARLPEVVYAATTDEGSLLRSDDAGQTWQPLGAGLPAAAIWALASDAASGALYAGTRRGLFRSADGGTTWTTTGLDPHEVGNLAVAGATLYAAIGESGIARSTDGGATWERASAGLGSVGGHVAAGADGTLYIGASGVFRSRDRGRTWTLSARGLWGSDVTALAPHPTRTATVYAGTRAGVFVSDDAAVTWRPTGLADASESHHREVRALSIDPTAPDHLWAATWEGLHHSADGGETWTRIAHRYLRDEPVAHIALHPRQAGTLYVAGDRGGRCGLLRSRDRGVTWQRLCRRDTEFTALAIDPRQPDALYAGIRTGNWSRTGVDRSIDGGRHWTPLFGQPADALAVDPTRPARLYATGWRYLFRSDDAGVTWDPFTAGLYRANLNGFAFVPGSPPLVVASTWDGIYAVEPVEPCRGDCRGDGRTSVEDLVSAVAIGLGAVEQGTCAAADRDASGSVEIAELIAAVADAMTGCADVAGAAWEIPARFALHREPQLMFAADIDRDDRVDALLVDAGGVHLWRGDGNAGFAPRPYQEVDGLLVGAHLTDLDGDGAPDLVAYVVSDDHSSPDSVQVLMNDGDGSFRAGGHYRMESAHSFSIATGDIDGDGVTDLVQGGAHATLAVRRGRGDGSFAPPSALSGGGCVSEYDCPRLLAIADLNADGAADIVLEWSVLLGLGDGTFAPSMPGGGSGVFAQLDDDRILDQVWYRGADQSFAVGAGAGDGTFAPALYFGAGGDCRALSIADLNADGAADVVCGIAPGWDDGTPAAIDRLAVMRNLGDGVFTVPQRLAAPLQPDAVATADVDGDGRLDLLAAGRCRSADASCRDRAAGVMAVWRGVESAASP